MTLACLLSVEWKKKGSCIATACLRQSRCVTANIAVAWLMFIVHSWFIYTPDFSCCTDEIS